MASAGHDAGLGGGDSVALAVPAGAAPASDECSPILQAMQLAKQGAVTAQQVQRKVDAEADAAASAYSKRHLPQVASDWHQIGFGATELVAAFWNLSSFWKRFC